MEDIKKYIEEQLKLAQEKMVNENTPDYWDTTGMIMKLKNNNFVEPWNDDCIIVGKILHTEPIEINNESGEIIFTKDNNLGFPLTPKPEIRY